MTNQAYHLVTSSNKKTWKSKHDLLYLGNWCFPETQTKIPNDVIGKIAKPLGEKKEECDYLLAEARRIESKFFPKITELLNGYHARNNNDRYWKILIGHWSRITIECLLNRSVSIQKCFDENNIVSVGLLKSNVELLPESNFTNSILKWDDEILNSQIYERIIRVLIEKPPILDFDFPNLENDMPKRQQHLSFQKSKVNLNFIQQARKISSKIVRASDALIVNSYLPLEKEFLLEILLGQFPKWNSSPEYETSLYPDVESRKEMGNELSKICNSKIELVIARLFFELMPIGYLEGFLELLQLSENQNWPKKTKFIFSSNNFVSDDVFKIWTANKVATGSKYIAGQHGGGYGTSKFTTPSIEEETADKFVTWGLVDENATHITGFVFKNATIKKYRAKKSGGLLFIHETYSPRFQLWDQSFRYKQYFSQLSKFVYELTPEISSTLTVRLSPTFGKKYTIVENELKELGNYFIVDSGEIPIRKLWEQHRLVVHSYDSTGLLETLESNIPTIAFWNHGFDHLLPEAIPYYEKLVEAGIVHYSAESAAKKINAVWTDIELWWDSDEVQAAKNFFCNRYARSSKKPVLDLRNILRDILTK